MDETNTSSQPRLQPFVQAGYQEKKRQEKSHQGENRQEKSHQNKSAQFKSSQLKNTQREKDDQFYLECEKHWIFMILIFVGGFFGAYTYTVRGGIFCNAQTANIVLLGMALGNQEWMKIIYLVASLIAYLMGTMLSEILAKRVKRFKLLRWDTIFIGIEIIIVAILAALPKSAPDQICQISLNFICSMQFNTFRASQGIPMATTFITNHVRQIAVNIVRSIRDQNKKASSRWKRHCIMLILFLLGAFFSAVMCIYFDVHALWFAIPFLIYAFIRLLIADRTIEKAYLYKTPMGH